jgi:hydroxyacylglutathione hydrolase
MIHSLRLKLSNVHLALEPAVILFDTGSPGEEHRILRWIESFGRGLPRATVLTHAHADHAGAAAALRQLTGAPICLAPADRKAATRGENGPLTPTRPSARPLAWLVPHRFTPFTPDVALDGPDALKPFGCPATLIATPGHTAGSVSALFPDGEAIVGDLLMGGYIGGMIRPNTPRAHYFAEDAHLLPESLARVLAAGARRLHVGHGGPISADRLKTWSPQ